MVSNRNIAGKVSGSNLLEQIRNVIRVKHYGLRTEQSYLQWIKRFIVFNGKRHPSYMGEGEVSNF